MGTAQVVFAEDPEDLTMLDRKSRHRNVLCMPGSAFPRFFLTIVVVQVPWLPEVTKGHVIPSGFPWMCECATGSCAISALVGPFHRKCPLVCSLGHPRPISSMATGTSPFTGYLPLLFSYNIQ
jgi:hypothetical protein